MAFFYTVIAKAYLILIVVMPRKGLKQPSHCLGSNPPAVVLKVVVCSLLGLYCQYFMVTRYGGCCMLRLSTAA